MRMYRIMDIVAGWVVFFVIGMSLVAFMYTQRYIEDTYTNTAKKGIIFTRTLESLTS